MPLPDDAIAEQLVDLLRWYGEMGVDAVVDEAPHDRLAEAAAAAMAPPDAVPASAIPPARGKAPLPGRLPLPPAARPLDAAALSGEAAILSAREAAAGAATLDELRAAMERFEGCALKRTASRLVFADGDPASRLMLVGEGPGAEEDRTGLPFVGRSGQLLDRMLGAVGLGRRGVYLANVVPWRPPGNRTPTPQEVAICLPFITRQIELADPRTLVFLGGSAMQALVTTKDGIMRARGRWLDYPLNGGTIRALPMLHPAYLLRQPGHKALAWRDLRALRKALGDEA